MSLKGNIGSIAKFSSALRRLPVVVAQRVTAASAPAITTEAQATFSAGADAYGVAWAPSASGDRVTLTRTGALAKYVRYVAIGTKLRVVLGVPYAKYQIGRRPIFPRQGGVLPASYVRTLAKHADAVIRAELGAS